MTLLELLVQELPKRGGWPEKANCITQDPDFRIEPAACHPHQAKYRGAWDLGSSRIGGFDVDVLSSDFDTAIVTREQYEAALQQSAWDGTGLPPVGCECEFYNGERYYTRDSAPQDGQKVKIVHHEVSGAGIPCAVFVWIGDDKSVKSEAAQEGLFRPIRSEADEKREDTIEAIASHALSYRCGADIYDAITAGKIPGIKLE